MVEFHDVKWRKVKDPEFKTLYERFPSIDLNLCPTCLGRKQFFYLDTEYECDCKTQMALTRHYLLANIGLAYHGLGFDDYHDNKQELKGLVEDYLANWETNRRYGRGIFFQGALGTGKTLSQVLILKEIVKRGGRCWFTSFNAGVSDYTDKESKDQLLRHVRQADCFAIDEIIPARTPAQRDLFEQFLEWVVRYRVENNLPTLGGTNINQFEDEYPRVYSLLQQSHLFYTVTGDDTRQETTKGEVEELIQTKSVRPVK